MEGIAPCNAYPCSDGASIIVAGNGDGIFGRYMRVIGRDDLADDPDLQTNAGRWRRRDELDDAIAAWTGSTPATRRSRSSTRRACRAARSTPPADICADEQYRERNMIQYFDVDTGDGDRSVGFPGIVPVVGGASLPIRSVGPDLGEHTREVLSSLSSAEPRRARQAGRP